MKKIKSLVFKIIPKKTFKKYLKKFSLAQNNQHYLKAQEYFEEKKFSLALVETNLILAQYQNKIPPLDIIQFALKVFHYSASHLTAWSHFSPKATENSELNVELLRFRYKWAKARWFLEKNRKIKNWGGELKTPNILQWKSIADDAAIILQSHGKKKNLNLNELVVFSRLLESLEYKSENERPQYVDCIRHVVFPTDPQSNLIDEVINDVFDYKLGRGLPKNVEKKLDQLCTQTHGFDFWFSLYDFFSFHALFNLALKSRTQALKTLEDSSLLKAKAMHALEVLDFAKIDLCLNQLDKMGKPQQNLKVQRSILKKEPIHSKIDSSVEQNFLNFVKGKTIAIVGPAPDGNLTGPEIDSYDIVVRFNYAGKHRLPESKEFGQRIDISYNSSVSLLPERDFSHLDHMKDLKFFVFKEPGVEISDPDIKSRAKPVYGLKLMHNVPNGVPSAIFDILHYQPKKIKIFKSNFFCSDIIYDQRYVAARETNFQADQKLSTIHDLLLTHDTLAQIIFVRNLHSLGIVDVDQTCEKILKFSDEEYMSRMQSIYHYPSE